MPKYTANINLEHWFKVTVEADDPEAAEWIMANIDYTNLDANSANSVIDDGTEFEIWNLEEVN